MSMLDQLFGALWRDYLVMTPVAARVHELLTARGETILNDHIALRTFDLDGIGIESLDRAFVTAGYEPVENYEFPDPASICRLPELTERAKDLHENSDFAVVARSPNS